MISRKATPPPPRISLGGQCMKLVRFFSPEKKVFDKLTFKEQKKLGALVSSDLVFLCLFLVFTIFLIIAYSKLLGFLTLLAMPIFLGSLVAIKKGKITAGSYLSTVGLVFICCITTIFVKNDMNHLVHYRTGFFCCSMAIVNYMAALRRRQLVIFHIFVHVLLIATNFTIYRAGFFMDPKPWIVSLVICIFGTANANFVLIFSSKNYNKIVSHAEKEKFQISTDFEKITNVLNQTKESLDIGERLNFSLDKTDKSATEINNLYGNLLQVTKDLKFQAHSVQKAGEEIDNYAAKMGEDIKTQNGSISETSAAVTEISSNISSINVIAEKRRQEMEIVVQILNNQNALIKKLVSDVNRVQESSKRIAAFVQTVDSIAGQTNLLAMNASIEAAHAGNAGKGFGVIAQEIRKLSNETTKNANQISDTLKENSEVVQESTKSVAEFAKSTESSTIEIKKTVDSMEEILRGINEMDIATKDVMKALQKIVLSASDNASAINSVTDRISDQNKDLAEIQGTADFLQKNADQISNMLKTITGAINEIQAIARENRDVSSKIADLLA
ncbi:MAG: methyl-accepting chemotaxis protein [Treponemataceae bacterium]